MLSKLYRKTIRALFRYDPTFMDWYHHPAFQERGAYYLKKVFSVLDQFPEEKRNDIKIVDLGCQAGRMTIPVLQAGFTQTLGIDTSGMALRAAQRTLKSLSLTGQFKKIDLARYVAQCPALSVDAIISIETLYLCLNFNPLIQNIAHILKPGGYLIATFKTKSYFFTEAILRNQLERARFVLHTSEGEVKDLGKNWQSKKELLHLLEANGIQCISSDFYYPFDPRQISVKKYLDLYPQDESKIDFLDDQGREIVLIGKKNYV
ncbi:MAG: methyltransferase domain-containing protein [Deltaproteobacteria bacterium]|nr:methyltransferase domain-containing protein [Deltaproteobacteria bacterium]